MQMALALLGVALVHYGLSQISQFTVAVPFQVSLLWLPAGFGVAAIAALGPKATLAVFVAALANSLHYDSGTAVAIATSLGSSLQCAAIAYGLGRWCGLGRLAHAGIHPGSTEFSGARFYMTLASGTVIAPTFGAMALCVSGIIAWPLFGNTWVGWWIGDLFGVMIAAPIAFEVISRLIDKPALPSWQSALTMSAIPLALLLLILEAAFDYQIILAYPGGLTAREMNAILGLASTIAIILIALLHLHAEKLRRHSEHARLALNESNEQIAAQARQLAALNDELFLRAQDAEKANRAKSEFLSTMSHELRTPLNAVVGYAYLLQREALSPSAKEYADQITSSSQHLLAMISDILDIARSESGLLTLTSEEFSLRTLLSDVQDITRQQANHKGLALTVEIDIAADLFRGDPVRLRQCLLNYVGNAIKFTDHGQIAIDVRARPHADGSALLRFRVKDTGIGIEAQQQSCIFDAFRQVDMSSQRRHGGAGLGLAITRKLAEAMGGAAGVQSEPGIGSTFWFTASVETPTLADGSDADQAAPESPEDLLREKYPGVRILIAEDDSISQAFMRLLLEPLGACVDLVDDGQQAIDKARTTGYDCVLMDVQMPGLTGVQATREIRRLPGWAQTPIIALTADARPENRQECLDAGTSGFLTKPVNPQQLLAVLVAALQSSDAQSGAGANNPG
jgi:signal transduction histidine kinase/CheY-like chemotaxis protein